MVIQTGSGCARIDSTSLPVRPWISMTGEAILMSGRSRIVSLALLAMAAGPPASIRAQIPGSVIAFRQPPTTPTLEKPRGPSRPDPRSARG